MRGCLFTVAFAGLVATLIVVVGLPAVAAGLLTAGVRAAGLQAADLTVSVTADPPWDLLSLQADRVRVRATAATFRGLQIGALDVTFLGASLVDRQSTSVAGRLTSVTAPNVAGQPLRLGVVTLSGGGSQLTATTSIAAADAQALIAAEIAVVTGVSVPPSAVRLAPPDRVTVKDPVTATATLSVDATGDLVANAPEIAPVTLLHAGEDVPIRFTAVKVDAQGNLLLTGTLTVGLLGG